MSMMRCSFMFAFGVMLRCLFVVCCCLMQVFCGFRMMLRCGMSCRHGIPPRTLLETNILRTLHIALFACLKNSWNYYVQERGDGYTFCVSCGPGSRGWNFVRQPWDTDSYDGGSPDLLMKNIVSLLVGDTCSCYTDAIRTDICERPRRSLCDGKPYNTNLAPRSYAFAPGTPRSLASLYHGSRRDDLQRGRMPCMPKVVRKGSFQICAVRGRFTVDGLGRSP